ncbi:MAG: hypothetical protein J6A83_05820, partial [Clostridia bacterium]|nr:hypothetical protein [Clostridia bacterium]
MPNNTFLSANIWQYIWDVASSGVFIAIYVAILALIFVWIILSLMSRDNKASKIVITGADIPATAPTEEKTEKRSKKEKKAEKQAEEKREEAPEITDEDEKKGRFCKLCHIDEIKSTLQRPGYDEHITLRQFCENFRNY